MKEDFEKEEKTLLSDHQQELKELKEVFSNVFNWKVIPIIGVNILG